MMNLKEMNVREYAEEIAKELGGYDVKQIEKANGIICTGIEIRTDNDVKPVVYVDAYYDHRMSVIDAISEINKILKSNNTSEFNGVIDKILDFNKIKDKLTLRLYNQKTKADLFASAEYMGFDDLILVPYIQITDEASIKVTKELLGKWNINEETLFAVATYNLMKSSDFEIKSLVQVMAEMQGIPVDMVSELETENPMYIVSNKIKSFGAVGILLPTIKAKLNVLFPDGYTVLPSSVHEVIVIGGGRNDPYFLEMVKQVNATEVKPEEVLSDNVYYFEGGKK